jgi:hypothetical protein
VHGPIWNDNRVGVTGEPKFRTDPPNYVTVEDSDGKRHTLVGDAANEYRRLHPPA